MSATETPPNGTVSGVATLTALTARQARGLWQRPSVVVARAVLADYLESGWVIGEAAVLAVFFLLAFHTPGDSANFFDTAYLGLGTLALLSGGVAVARTLRPRTYAPLAERYSSTACARGLALALAAVRIGSFTYLLSLALLSGRLGGASFGAVASGSLGLLANVTLVALFAAALTPPFLTSRERIAFLAWLVAALYSYADGGFLARVCTLARLPLLPVGALFAAGITGSLGWGGLLAIPLVVGYALALVWLIARRLETRAVLTDKPAPLDTNTTTETAIAIDTIAPLAPVADTTIATTPETGS